MKRQISTTVLCLTFLLLGACSSALTGHVYLDANSNKEVDAGEKGVQGVHYTVTQDGNKIGEGYTDATGAFDAIKVKAPGKYCINLNKTSLQGLDPNFKPSLSMSALIEGVAPAPTPAPKSVAKDVSNSNTPPPADPYAKPAAAPAPAAAAAAGPTDGTVTITPLSGCVQMGQSGQILDLPIIPDYSATIQGIPTPATKSLAPGDNYDFKIIWPTSCRLLSSAIPDIFISTGDVGITSDTSPMFDFSEPVVADNVSQAKDLTHDGLSSKVVHLRVRGNVLGDKTRHILQQSVLCPDEITYQLPAQEITIASTSMVSVAQNLVGAYGLGDSPTDEVTIVNNTPQSIMAAKLTVSFSNVVDGVSSDETSCKNLGDDVTCLFDLKPNEKKVVKIKFTLPKTVTVTTTSTKEEYSIGATLNIASQTDVITADKIHFYLLPAKP